MVLSTLRFIIPIFAMVSSLQATIDISNLNNCINEVRSAEASPPTVITFDAYTNDYNKLLSDLKVAAVTLPYVYQQAASTPLINLLTGLGEAQYLQIFNSDNLDERSQAIKEMLPDAALSILFNNSAFSQAVSAFQETVGDIYASFIDDERTVSKKTGRPIAPPTYGVIPPLVKFGNADSGPYTWTSEVTSHTLGMKCAVVSLPPANIQGGLLAWTALGHETGGHDVIHADDGLLNELSQKIYSGILSAYRSPALASYWAGCTDELVSDVRGYLTMGPSAGVSLIGYFRALGNGKLRTIGSQDDTHPIDLLRGYLAAAVVALLDFKDAATWSQIIYNETSKDNNNLYFEDQNGNYSQFPVSLPVAIASAKTVAQIVVTTPMASLQNYKFKDIQSWNNNDQAIVDTLVANLNSSGKLPANLSGPGFYAAHVVSAAVKAGLQAGSNIQVLFREMINFLDIMHSNDPTWSTKATPEALKLLERASEFVEQQNTAKLEPRVARVKVTEDEFKVVATEELFAESA